MKSLLFLLFLVLLTSIPCFCQGAASTPQKNGQHTTASQQRDSYQEKAEATLRELNRKINALNAKAGKQSSDARREIDRQMADLTQKRAAAQRQLEKLKNSTQKAWRDMKPDLDAALKNLQAAYQHAAANFK